MDTSLFKGHRKLQLNSRKIGEFPLLLSEMRALFIWSEDGLVAQKIDSATTSNLMVDGQNRFIM